MVFSIISSNTKNIADGIATAGKLFKFSHNKRKHIHVKKAFFY